MKKIKIIFCLMMLIIISLNNLVYADDEIDEENITWEEIEEILETASEIEEIPTINAKNAIIYDRTSRGNNIWERRK